MKMWTDEDGKQWLVPIAFGVPGRPIMSCYLMRDNEARLHSFSADVWNTLPFHWWAQEGPTEMRPDQKPNDLVKL